MEEATFTLWHDPSNSVREEVICGIDNGCAIMQTEDAGDADAYGDVCEVFETYFSSE